MSQENVEIVRRALDLSRSGDLAANAEALIALVDPRLEFISALSGVEGAAYRGHEGIRLYLHDLADSWREWRFELKEIEEVAPDTILVSLVFHATGKESGVPIETERSLVYVLSEGRLLRVRNYHTRAEALEAAGLSE
jgi:ketosteroid isomerase-like protein